MITVMMSFFFYFLDNPLVAIEAAARSNQYDRSFMTRDFRPCA